jgi:hypothetical protein
MAGEWNSRAKKNCVSKLGWGRGQREFAREGAGVAEFEIWGGRGGVVFRSKLSVSGRKPTCGDLSFPTHVEHAVSEVKILATLRSGLTHRSG